ncbi:MAG: hypothetical protein JKY60_03420 [Kordiimonadaceae bacterium]|nr:hypothetical protein [Kordiimonadaceae bacterium]
MAEHHPAGAGQNVAHPFIAPDESYLIWDGERENRYGGSDLYSKMRSILIQLFFYTILIRFDFIPKNIVAFQEVSLYISFQQKDGSWGATINMGDKINTDLEDAFGSVTPDRKYLFFYRAIGPRNLDIFWVNAQIIETLRSK